MQMIYERRSNAAWFRCSLLLVMVGWAAAVAAGTEDPLAAWREGVTVRPVSQRQERHTIHAYFNVSPESPDGAWVVFYASTTKDGHEGELRILERATGQERVIAQGIVVEDAHRAACQQWLSGGRRVVFHNLRDGHWFVAAVDVATGREQVLVRDRQVGWGTADKDLVPVYGCHWNPGEHRDLELVNAETGAVQAVVTAAAVQAAYPAWIQERFGDRPVSIFFPVLSPDANRVFFKMATPAGGEMRSSKASQREGLVGYDLAQARFLLMREHWGHPAWHPDSRQIIEPGLLLIDSETKATRRLPGLPSFSGSHPSISPDGRLFVTDCQLNEPDRPWGIVVGRIEGGESVVVHRFNNSQGARSWRRSHPHPVFSPDGKRIYFNVNSTAWTELFVAESKTQ